MPRFLSRLGLLAAVAFAALTACSDELDPDALWPDGDFDSPEPNQLKGVYQLFTTDGNFNIEIRLRFTDHTLVGGIRCQPKNPKFKGLEAGGTSNLGIADVNAASGRFDVDALNLSKSDGDLLCEGGLAGDTYDFKVEDKRLTLTRKGVNQPIIYSKIGQ